MGYAVTPVLNSKHALNNSFVILILFSPTESILADAAYVDQWVMELNLVSNHKKPIDLTKALELKPYLAPTLICSYIVPI